MIHREGEIQTSKGCGSYNFGKFISADIVGWYINLRQQIAARKNPLRWSEILQAIACVNPPLKNLEEWGESVYSFSANGNKRIDAALDLRDRKGQNSGMLAGDRRNIWLRAKRFAASSGPLESGNPFIGCFIGFCYESFVLSSSVND